MLENAYLIIFNFKVENELKMTNVFFTFSLMLFFFFFFFFYKYSIFQKKHRGVQSKVHMMYT